MTDPRLVLLPRRSRTATRAHRVLRRLPPLSGAPIRLFPAGDLRDGSRSVHAASFLRERSIGLNCPANEFPRVFVHELFHFVWLRLGNPRRRSYEALLGRERNLRARGELGWSAEWRKIELADQEAQSRSRLWREYCCESFCDTAAWLYSGVQKHAEFTLANRYRHLRQAWFASNVARIDAGEPLLL
jgi:hypothetical protein